jgi:hypothetical protein
MHAVSHLGRLLCSKQAVAARLRPDAKPEILEKLGRITKGRVWPATDHRERSNKHNTQLAEFAEGISRDFYDTELKPASIYGVCVANLN